MDVVKRNKTDLLVLISFSHLLSMTLVFVRLDSLQRLFHLAGFNDYIFITVRFMAGDRESIGTYGGGQSELCAALLVAS